jgi:hypothetical protein
VPLHSLLLAKLSAYDGLATVLVVLHSLLDFKLVLHMGTELLLVKKNMDDPGSIPIK